MRRLFSLLVMSMLMGVAWGQAYSYRYWLDYDYATAKSGSARGETQFSLDLRSMAPGMHAIHVQAQNSEGVWSSAHTRYFMNMTKQTAVSACYWIDNDVTTMHTGVATSGVIDIDVSRMTVGPHAIHYQSFADDGTASAVHTRYLYVNKVHRDILTAAVSIDNGVAKTYALADGDIVIDIGELHDGEHSLKVVLTDIQGVVQGTQQISFTVQNRLSGDLNGDNAVDIGDIVMVISVMTGSETTPNIVAAADVNDDGAADIGDIVAIIGIMTSQTSASRELVLPVETVIETINVTE